MQRPLCLASSVNHRVVGDEAESGKEPNAESLMSHGREFELYF